MRSRARLSLNSVRVRLALWNVGILAFVLIGLGVVFVLSMRANISTAVDHRLSARAHHMQGFFAGGPPPLISRTLTGKNPRFGPPLGHSAPNQARPGGSPEPREDGFSDDLRPRLFTPQGAPLPNGLPAWDQAGLRRAAGGDEAYTDAHDGTQAVRVLSVPLSRDGKIVALAQFGNSLTRIQEEQARTTRTLVTLIPLVLLIAGLGGAFLTDRALRPVRGIAHAAGKIEAGKLSRRLPVVGDDEFADLAETFNGMLARLQAAFERQEQAFEQQRRFTADASHELRTPLTIIKANSSLALSGVRTVDQLRKTLQTVDTAADRMNRIVQDLLLLARSDAGQLTYALVPTPLADVLGPAMAAIQGAGYAPVTVSLNPPSLQVRGNVDALVRLFSNLLENAARYTPPDGRITVSAEPLGDVVRVKVADTGEGIAPEHLAHVTERFYRAEAARSRAHGGTGLGLSICRSILEAHGGTLEIESRPDEGTTVRITLPQATSDVEDRAGAAPAEAAPALVGS